MSRLHGLLVARFAVAAEGAKAAILALEEGYFFALPEGPWGAFFHVAEYSGRCCRIFLTIPGARRVQNFYYQPGLEEELGDWLLSQSLEASRATCSVIVKCLSGLVTAVGMDGANDALIEAVASSVMND